MTMAQELQATISINYTNGSDNTTRTQTATTDVSAMPRASGVQIIGIVEESLEQGDVANIGKVFIQNLDTVNFLTYGSVTGQLDSRIDPGDFAWFRPTANAVFIMADTAIVNVAYEVFSAP
jgi:hypothetical protein